MPTLKADPESIELAARIIREGGIAAFPTETVYGLGGDAFNPAALAKIFEAKGRPRFDPLIVHIADAAMLARVADLSLLDAAARERLDLLAAAFWPGPLTLILPKRDEVPDIATSGLPSVAVRMPAHEVARRIIALAGGAVAAPSANPFGFLSPTRAEHVERRLGDRVSLIVDGGPTQVGVESTVLDVPGRRILRPGGIARESIEEVVGRLEEEPVAAEGGAQVSPGMLDSHYAPHSALVAHPGISILEIPPAKGGDAAFLFFDGETLGQWRARHSPSPGVEVRALSPSGDIAEAASGLFQALHELDGINPGRIHAQMAPDRGLGIAINDRLKRGTAKAPCGCQGAREGREGQTPPHRR